MLQISKLNSNQYDLWDAYIDKNKNAHFSQSTSWKKAVESTYGYKSIFLMAKEEEKIKSILPLFYNKSKSLIRSVTRFIFHTISIAPKCIYDISFIS